MEVAVRDVQITMAAVVVTAATFLVLPTKPSRPYAMLVGIGSCALLSVIASAWTPSVLGGIILPFILGVLPGLALASLIVLAFADYACEATGLSTGAVHFSPSRSAAEINTGLCAAFVGIVLILGAQAVAVVAPDAHALALVFVAATVVAVVGAVVALFNKRSRSVHLVWVIFTVIATVGTLLIGLAVRFTESVMWTIFMHIIFLLFALTVGYMVSAMFSGDAHSAVSAMMNAVAIPTSFGESGDNGGASVNTGGDFATTSSTVPLPTTATSSPSNVFSSILS